MCSSDLSRPALAASTGAALAARSWKTRWRRRWRRWLWSATSAAQKSLASFHCKTGRLVRGKDGGPDKHSARVLRENLSKRTSKVPIVLHEGSDNAAISFERIAQSLCEVLDPLVS